MPIAMSILGELVDGVLDTGSGLDGTWTIGKTYKIEVSGIEQVTDYLSWKTSVLPGSSPGTLIGWHWIRFEDIRFNLLNEKNQKFQSLDEVAVSYAYDITAGDQFSNIGDIVTSWSGDRLALITKLDSTTTSTEQIDTWDFYDYLGADIAEGQRVKQTLTESYSVLIYKEPPDSYQGDIGDYYFATWRYTTPNGDADEGVGGISATLLAYYEALYQTTFYHVQQDFIFDFASGSPQLTKIYMNYTQANLQTLKITIVGDGAVVPPTYPPARPDTYDPDGVSTLGGGRYKQHLVVIGFRKIYFGDV